MAKAAKGKAKEENGAAQGGQQGPQGQGQQPMLNVLAQFTKDFSFENPKAPDSLRPREKPPEIDINVNVNAKPMGDNNYEIVLVLEAKAQNEGDLIFNAELTYAGIFRLTGIPPQTMQPALLIECPRILFPFARQIIADATRHGGFPPLLIDPIDFARLYQTRMQNEQAGAEATN